MRYMIYRRLLFGRLRQSIGGILRRGVVLGLWRGTGGIYTLSQKSVPLKEATKSITVVAVKMMRHSSIRCGSVRPLLRGTPL